MISLVCSCPPAYMVVQRAVRSFSGRPEDEREPLLRPGPVLSTFGTQAARAGGTRSGHAWHGGTHRWHAQVARTGGTHRWHAQVARTGGTHRWHAQVGSTAERERRRSGAADQIKKKRLCAKKECRDMGNSFPGVQLLPGV